MNPNRPSVYRSVCHIIVQQLGRYPKGTHLLYPGVKNNKYLMVKGLGLVAVASTLVLPNLYCCTARSLILLVCAVAGSIMPDVPTGAEKEDCEKRKEAYDCYVRSNNILSQATELFIKVWNAARPKGSWIKKSAARKLIQRAVKSMQTTFSLRTKVPSGPSPRVPDSVIQQCGTIIAAGHMQDCSIVKNGSLYRWGELRYFTSLNDAISNSVQLKQLCQLHGMKVNHLRRRLHDCVPELKYHGVYMRQPLSQKILEARMAYSNRMCNFTSAGWESLLDVHWMDECTIWVGKDLVGQKLCVWSYRGCTEGLQPEANRWFLSHPTLKISLLLVVNGRTGFTYVEVLTGTGGKPGNWRLNPEMQATMVGRHTLLGDYRYKVS